MSERPLVLFANPTIADKERRHGGAPRYYIPSHSRQVSRLNPQFNVLQNAINSGNVYFTNYATGVEPEYTLVFETVGRTPNDISVGCRVRWKTLAYLENEIFMKTGRYISGMRRTVCVMID